jgi:hypothetical protein
MLEPRTDRPTRTTPPYLPDSDDWFALEDWVGADRPSRRDDVAKVEALLAAAGDLSFERTQGPTGYWGLTQDAALRRYQRRHGLAPDGALRPGGPTILDMGERYGAMFLGQTPPTAADIDAHHDALARGDAAQIVWNRDEAGGQPLGTKVAATDLVGDGLLAARLFGSAILAKGAADAARDIETTPFTPAENKGFKEEFVPAPVPDPNDTGGFTPVGRAPTHTGHATPEPARTEPLVNVPALPQKEREHIVETFVDQFILEYRYKSGEDDKRGADRTVRLNNVTARACKKAIENSKYPELIKQLGGASIDGAEEKLMHEKRLPTNGAKSRQPDYLMGVGDEHGQIKHAAAINTITTRADGSPTPREQAQLDDLNRANVIRYVDSLAKVGETINPEDSFDEAYRKCTKGVRALELSIEAELEAMRRKSGGQARP